MRLSFLFLVSLMIRDWGQIPLTKRIIFYKGNSSITTAEPASFSSQSLRTAQNLKTPPSSVLVPPLLVDHSLVETPIPPIDHRSQYWLRSLLLPLPGGTKLSHPNLGLLGRASIALDCLTTAPYQAMRGRKYFRAPLCWLQ